ncbi:MAG: hypothetical protein WC438_05475 [Candidatus Pacearchaeota archaeon]
MIKKTTIKKNKKVEEKQLVNATFLDKKGERIKVTDIVSKEDCWFLKRENKYVLTHKAIEEIAHVAGISLNYDVEESPNIVPDYKNELEHVVRITIHCKAKHPTSTKTEGCVHSDEAELTITGEANRMSAPNRGRGYLRKMAEKRGFDIAVLKHLGLYSSVFSEDEAEKFEQKREPDIMPGTKDFEDIIKEINAILNCKSLQTLQKIGKKIKLGVKENKYSDKQLKYLRELYQKEYGKKNNEF